MEIASGAGPDGWRGRGEFTSPDEGIVLSIDYDEEDFHIDARPGHSPAAMKAVLAQARARGLEPMNADECEPEILEDSTIRVYLTLAERAVAVELQEKRRKSAAKGMTLAFALTASVAVALLIPSPLHHQYTPTEEADTVQTHAPRHHADPIYAPAKGH